MIALQMVPSHQQPLVNQSYFTKLAMAVIVHGMLMPI